VAEQAGHAESGVQRAPGLLARTGVSYEAREIGKSFDGTSVLHDVTVHFRPGEIHSLIGENGAGKSTLLKIMAGMYSCDHGSLVLDGKVLSALTPRDAQRHGVYLTLSGCSSSCASCGDEG
jgi:ABC-type sugar transport system ATPase subunit